jgi:putative hemolysin
VILSAFFSGSEIALSSLDKLTLKRLIKEKGKKGRQVEFLLTKPSRWLITILIGNNFVNIAAASLATLLVQEIVKGTAGQVVGIATGVMTFVILIFGEILPKSYCQQHAEEISIKVARPILLLSKILSPLVKALTFFTRTVLRLSGTKEIEKSRLITEREIHALIDLGQEEGALEEQEEELVHSALEFDETQAKEIMVPRTNMVCINEEASLVELADLIKKAGYSRIPVYQKNIDNITGIAYARDLLNFINNLSKENKVKEIMHPPIFVAYTINLGRLFRRLQKEKTHLAIIVDEYGGVAGMLTIEDLLEEIVGEIEDEYDKAEEKIIILKDGAALIKAETDIDEINEKLGTHLPEKTDAFESIGGFIFDALGRIPVKGEIVEWKNLKIKIVDADKRHIKKVRIWQKTEGGSEK